MPAAQQNQKALFVPLKTRWFREFESGRKTTEYRRYGRGWNENTCVPGRPVVLSHGYSGARINARVLALRVVEARTVPDAAELYAPHEKLAAIELRVYLT